MKSVYTTNFIKYEDQIQHRAIEAFKEDLGSGDITTDAIFANDHLTSVVIVAEESATLAGILEARAIFEAGGLTVTGKKDGAKVKKGSKVLKISGSLKEILARERVALNYITRMSGIATLSAKIFKKHGKRVIFLRKTDPGLLFSEKRAVAIGGCLPHRLNLSDGFLIKDNHINELARKGDRITAIIKSIVMTDVYRKEKKIQSPVEIEVESLKEASIAAGVFTKTQGENIILLDNMTPAEVAKAARTIRKRCPGTVVEASGGITEKNISAYLKGADYVSTSLFTSAKPSKFKLEISK